MIVGPRANSQVLHALQPDAYLKSYVNLLGQPEVVSHNSSHQQGTETPSSCILSISGLD